MPGLQGQAAATAQALESRQDTTQTVRFGQARVGVQKKQPVARCRPGAAPAGPRLADPAGKRRVCVQYMNAGLLRDRPRRVCGTIVDDDQLMRPDILGHKRSQQGRQPPGLVVRGDDDRHTAGQFLTVAVRQVRNLTGQRMRQSTNRPASRPSEMITNDTTIPVTSRRLGY